MLSSPPTVSSCCPNPGTTSSVKICFLIELGEARGLREGMDKWRTEMVPTSTTKLIEEHEESAYLVKRDEEQEGEEQKASIALIDRGNLGETAK
ncbi:hypothetical protein FF1_002661 [Malus domestica]